jgi:hypothetical protein
LEGLEISIVRKQHVLDTVSTKRLDPEYFQKRYLLDESFIERNSHSFRSSGELGIAIDASAFYPSIEEFYGSGDLPFYRVGDVDGLIDDEGALRIPHQLCEQLPTLRRVQEGDILFTKGGAIDRSGYVTKEGAVSRDLIFLNTSNLPENDRLALFAYFQTALFRRLLTRSSSQTAQPHLTITLVRQLPFFQSSAQISSKLAGTILAAYRQVEAAKGQLDKASGVILTALGLADWTPPEPLAYAAKASEALAAGRLDARFFAPRIQALLDILSSDGRAISDVAKPRREKFRSEQHVDFDYIEISDMDGAGATGSTQMLAAEAPSRATWHVRPGDIITSSVRPIRRLSAQIMPEQAGFVCSSGFVVINPEDIAPEVLLTYLRLPVICELLDLYASASMYPSITDADIFNLPMPELPDELEAQIVAHVQDARAAKARAAALLDAAKRAVEIAIEDSEAAALAHLAAVEGAG